MRWMLAGEYQLWMALNFIAGRLRQCRAGPLENWGSIPGGEIDFFLLHHFGPALRPTQPLFSRYWGLFLEAK
jgi:hypothetical protein